MRMNSQCMACMIKSEEEKIREYADEGKKDRYIRELMKIMIDEQLEFTAPECLGKATEIREMIFGETDSYAELKRYYNEQVMKEIPFVESVVEKSEDSLKAALKVARVGNYIDCMATPELDEKEFEFLLYKVEEEELDENVYQAFLKDLQKAKRLVYITDNCGEVVLDKICLDEIHKLYPELYISVIVRGSEVINDATMKDAIQVGMVPEYHVVGNGTKVAGTSLRYINKESREIIENADLIISKGQGNHETLSGCGLNIYYLLLCKCDFYIKKFKAQRLQGVFLREKE